MAAAKAKPGIYHVPAGAAVRVDVAKLPPAKQAAAKADFEQNLRDAGYAMTATAPAVFTLTLDPASTKSTTFANVPNVTYTHQPQRVQLWSAGKVV